MAVLRKIVLSLLLIAAAGVLGMATWELWNHNEWTSLPSSQPVFNASDRARLLQERMDLLAKRVGDMQLLVLILLGTSGLYAIVFVASSYFSATSFARQADQTIANLQDQIGLAMGDLRELQEQTERRIHQMLAAPAPAPVTAVPPQPVLAVAAVPEAAPAVAKPAPAWEAQIAEIAERLEGWEDGRPATLKLVEDEYRTISVEVTAGARALPSLAGVYFRFGRLYAQADGARSRFYLERALRLAAPESSMVSEIHYQLACSFAGSHDFPHAMRELAAAFEHQFKTLDEKLAGDIEEGGKLYDLASTAPFDKAVNDLLLNMSVGIG
jgi:hypothetical protein